MFFNEVNMQEEKKQYVRRRLVNKLECSVKIVGYVSYLTLRLYLDWIFTFAINFLSTLVPDEDAFNYLKQSKFYKSIATGIA